MCFTRNLKTVGVLLIVTACLAPSAAPGETRPLVTRPKVTRVQSKLKATKLPNRIPRPRISGLGASTATTAKKSTVAAKHRACHRSVPKCRALKTSPGVRGVSGPKFLTKPLAASTPAQLRRSRTPCLVSRSAGAKGASGLREMCSTGGRNRNR